MFGEEDDLSGVVGVMGELTVDRFEHSAQLAEPGALQRDVVGGLGNRHQAAQAQVRQLGNRLRVLLPRRTARPVELIRAALAAGNPGASVEEVGASLEDVFVAATRLREDAAPPGRAA